VKKLLSVLAGTILLAGCASYDFSVTSFKQKTKDERYSYYVYKAFADSIYPIESKDAEQIRIRWLERWFDQNGISRDNYEVISREVYLRSESLIGAKIYDIFYEVKVPLR